MTAVLLVQAHDRVRRRARAREEVEDDGVGLVLHEEAKSVLDGIERLWERKLATRHKATQEGRTMLGSVVSLDLPLGWRKLKTAVCVNAHSLH